MYIFSNQKLSPPPPPPPWLAFLVIYLHIIYIIYVIIKCGVMNVFGIWHDVGEKIEEIETKVSFAHFAQVHFFNGFRLQKPLQIKFSQSVKKSVKVQGICRGMSYWDRQSAHWGQKCTRERSVPPPPPWAQSLDNRLHMFIFFENSKNYIWPFIYEELPKKKVFRGSFSVN